jgi:hypothetical protein
LPDEIIDYSALWASRFYKQGYYNDFRMLFSGMMYYSNLTKHSANEIANRICKETGNYGLSDHERKWHDVIETALELGNVGSPVVGSPSMKKFLQKKMGLSVDGANEEVIRIRKAWLKVFNDYKDGVAKASQSSTDEDGDIGTVSFDGKEIDVNPDTGHYNTIYTVSKVRQKHTGNMTLKGRISRIQRDCKGIIGIKGRCSNCNYIETLLQRRDFGRPKLYNPISKTFLSKKRCASCNEAGLPTNPEDLICELVNVSLIEIQDIKNFNESNQLRILIKEST